MIDESRNQRHRIIVFALFVYCLSLYPAVLRFTQSTGYDAPIYWRAARGDLSLPELSRGGIRAGWCYSDRLLPLLSLAKSADYGTFLFVIHFLNSIGVAALLRACLRGTYDYPILAGFFAFVVGSKASDVVAGGNITGMLCGLSLTPAGALVACAIKPYFVLALVFHAALWGFDRLGRDSNQDLRSRPSSGRRFIRRPGDAASGSR